MQWYKVRKRPIVVRCRPFEGDPDDPDVMVTSIANGGQVKSGFVVNTLEGPVQITPGDWIMEGVRDEKYPINHGVLLETYDFLDKVEEE